VVGVVILRITSFTDLSIVGFDPIVVEVGDLVVSMQYSRFCTQVAVWLKTRVQSSGWQWSLVQSSESKFYFISPWPFESS
jgi:hypothetical protein